MKRPPVIQFYPKFLWLLILSYTLCVVLSNWVDARLFSIGSIITDGAVLTFSLTFLLSSLIAEVYGYKQARLIIWCGFFFNTTFLLYGLLISSLPNPNFIAENQAFDKALLTNFRMFSAGTVSYLVAESINVYLLSKWKVKARGQYMWQRFLGASFISICTDTLLFIFLTFAGTMTSHQLLFIMFNTWITKFFMIIIFTPLFVKIANRLKNSEQIDIYDTYTKFNILSLDTEYLVQANRYPKKAKN